MSVQAYLTTTSIEDIPLSIEEVPVETREERQLPMLGSEEDAVAIRLQELFEAITSSMASSIDVESQLTVEVTGSISLKARGGFQYLFINAGAEASQTGTMKVVLSTTLQPKHGDS